MIVQLALSLPTDSLLSSKDRGFSTMVDISDITRRKVASENYYFEKLLLLYF